MSVGSSDFTSLFLSGKVLDGSRELGTVFSFLMSLGLLLVFGVDTGLSTPLFLTPSIVLPSLTFGSGARSVLSGLGFLTGAPALFFTVPVFRAP